MQTYRIAWMAVLTVAGMAVLPVAAQAQTVNHRQAEQHARIHQGVVNGTLTRHEVHKLSRREAAIRAQEARDRRRHNGHLTTAERARISRELSHTSHAIHRDRHNGAVRHS